MILFKINCTMLKGYIYKDNKLIDAKAWCVQEWTQSSRRVALSCLVDYQGKCYAECTYVSPPSNWA